MRGNDRMISKLKNFPEIFPESYSSAARQGGATTKYEVFSTQVVSRKFSNFNFLHCSVIKKKIGKT